MNISQIKSCWVGESEKNIKGLSDNTVEILTTYCDSERLETIGMHKVSNVALKNKRKMAAVLILLPFFSLYFKSFYSGFMLV